MRASYLSAVITLLSTQVFADNFMLQNGPPTYTHSPALQIYVNTISTYKPETMPLTVRLQKIINYYQRVHILKTLIEKTYTVDCIPFAEQPALIDQPLLAKRLLPSIREETQKNLPMLKQVGSNFDFNPASECPLGTVVDFGSGLHI